MGTIQVVRRDDVLLRRISQEHPFQLACPSRQCLRESTPFTTWRIPNLRSLKAFQLGIQPSDVSGFIAPSVLEGKTEMLLLVGLTVGIVSFKLFSLIWDKEHLGDINRPPQSRHQVIHF